MRIVSSFLSGNAMTIHAEFINPDKTDYTLTATVGSGYTAIDYTSKERKNEFDQTQESKTIKAGDCQTQQVTVYLSKGSQGIASEPMIFDRGTQ